MKREIKFRGKRVDNSAWIYGGYHVHNEVALCIASKEQHEANKKHLIVIDGMADWNMSVPINCFEVDPESIGQFTGLKDKNGVEIYEGDVVIPRYNNLKSFEVKFINGAFNVSRYNIENVEIIGNIYKNPELLNPAKE